MMLFFLRASRVITRVNAKTVNEFHKTFRGLAFTGS